MNAHPLSVRRLAVVVAVAGLALAGCSTPTGGGTAAGSAGTAPAVQVSGASTGKSGGTEGKGQGGGTGSQAPLRSGALPVLATHDANATAPVSVDLNEVQVSGKVAQVTFTVHDNAAEDTWSAGDFFADGVIQWKGSGADQGPVDQFTVDGVYLIDPVNAKRYLAARAEDGSCACSGDLPYLDPGGSETMTVLFAAPPADVATVDVHIPNVGPFSGVPVSR
jgi:hypothetical protein